MSDQQGAPNTRESELRQAGARLTDPCNKILTFFLFFSFLSQTVTSQTCVVRGGEREESFGGGQEEQALG